MTITVNLSVKAEQRLRERAVDSGQPIAHVASELMEAVLMSGPETDIRPVGMRSDEDFSEYLERMGVLGAFEGTVRADGRPWSEIEAACDAH